jgi:hypothetical protein
MTTDEQAIREIAPHLEENWNRGDSKNYVEPFAKDVACRQAHHRHAADPGRGEAGR